MHSAAAILNTTLCHPRRPNEPRPQVVSIRLSDEQTVERKMYLLLPRHPVYLPPRGRRRYGHFIAAFRQAWRRFPLGIRRALLRHWRSHPSRDLVAGSPAVELLEDWSRRGQALAWCGALGHSFRFRGPVVDAMPEEVAADLVAYELGHAYLFAIGDETHVGGPPGPEAEEQLLDFLWQLDMEDGEERIDRWLGENQELLKELNGQPV